MWRKNTHTYTQQQNQSISNLVFSNFYSWFECECLWNIYHNPKLYISEWIDRYISNNGNELLDKMKIWNECGKITCLFQYQYHMFVLKTL